MPVWNVLWPLSVDEKKGNKSGMEQVCDRCVAEGLAEDQLHCEIQIDRGGSLYRAELALP